jgi:hypothetical protein
MHAKQTAVLLAHAFVGWALCAATMGVGIAVTTLGNTLIVHAIAAPVFFAVVSLVYFRRFGYTTPLRTATIFVGFVVLVDFFVVALLINHSVAMFTSALGTWIPFALIFASTYLTGRFATGFSRPQAQARSNEGIEPTATR